MGGLLFQQTMKPSLYETARRVQTPMGKPQDDEKQQLMCRIRREIARLQKEFKELQMLREAADEIKYFRKYLLAECQRFD